MTRVRSPATALFNFVVFIFLLFVFCLFHFFFFIFPAFLLFYFPVLEILFYFFFYFLFLLYFPFFVPFPFLFFLLFSFFYLFSCFRGLVALQLAPGFDPPQALRGEGARHKRRILEAAAHGRRSGTRPPAAAPLPLERLCKKRPQTGPKDGPLTRFWNQA